MTRAHAQVDLGRVLREGDLRRLARSLTRLDDAQIGVQLDNLEASEQDRILQLLPVERRPVVVGFMREETAAQVVRRIAPEEAAALIDQLESDDAVDILGRLNPAELKAILARLEDRLAREDVLALEELLAYDGDTAGGIMSPEFISVVDSATVAETLRIVRELDDPPEQAFYVYVVDDDERLVGVISLRTLVTSKTDQSVREIIYTELVTVSANADQEEVALLASRYDLVAIPVVDSQNRLLGLITIDDIVDVIRQEATEDILKMAGAGEALLETRSFAASLRARLPWLGAAAFGGFLVAISLKGFAEELALYPALAMFMPVIVGMGGNVGTQSSTIVVRGLAVGFVENNKVSRMVLREMSLGIALGIIYGGMIAIGASFLVVGLDPWRLGATLVLGMVASMTIAATVGSATPLLLDRLNIDPALATGPFVTTSVDVLGLLSYFLLASSLLGVGR